MSEQTGLGRWDRRDWAAVAFLLGLTLCLLRRALFSSGLLLGHPSADMAQYFFFNRFFGFKTLGEGFPLWNPHIFFGAPFLAQLQSALFYPPNYLLSLLPVETGLNWIIALHVFIAGASMYGFVRYAASTRFGALAGAIAYMLGSGVVMRIYAGHLNVLTTAALLPLIFLAAEILLRNPGRRTALAGALLYGLAILCGYIQVVFFATVGLAAYVTVRLLIQWRRGEPARSLLRTALALALMGGAGVLLAAVQIIPTLELGTLSARAGEGYDFASVYSLPPENLLTMAFPGLLGDAVNIPYWGRWQFVWEMSLYAGVLIWMSALAGAFFLRGPLPRALTVMGCLCLVLAIGKYTPVLKIFLTLIPGADIFRGYSKFGLLFLFAEAALAGVWLGRVFGDRRPPDTKGEGEGKGARKAEVEERGSWLRGPLLLWGALSLACLLALLALWFAGEPFCRRILQWLADSSEAFSMADEALADRAFLWGLHSVLRGAGVAVILFLLLVGYARTRLPRRAFQIIVILILLLDLWTFASPYARTFSLDRVQWPDDLVSTLEKKAEPFRILNLGRLHNQGMLYGVDMVGGFEAGIIRGPNRYINLSQGFHLDSHNAYGQVRQISDLLGAANCRYILLSEPVADLPLPLVGSGPGWALYEDPGALPRAYCVFAARVLPDDEAAARALSSSAYDPRAWAAVAGPADLDLPGTSNVLFPTPFPEITRCTRKEVSLTVDMPARGLLVLSDTFYPGWEALVDGAHRPIHRVNLAFRGVVLGSGRHEVIFRFRPRAFYVGATVSAVTLVLVLIGLLRSRKEQP